MNARILWAAPAMRRYVRFIGSRIDGPVGFAGGIRERL
jgi:hypothetical protein